MSRTEWRTFLLVAPLAFVLTLLVLDEVDAWRLAPATDWWGLAARAWRVIWGNG